MTTCDVCGAPAVFVTFDTSVASSVVQTPVKGRYCQEHNPIQIKWRHSVTSRIIVCLCGSTRFSEAYREANLRETLAGKIVLTIGCDMRSDGDLLAHMTDAEREQVKANLDALHLDKIALADEILVLNVGGYIGDSTRREIAHAQRHGLPIRYLEPIGE